MHIAEIFHIKANTSAQHSPHAAYVQRCKFAVPKHAVKLTQTTCASCHEQLTLHCKRNKCAAAGAGISMSPRSDSTRESWSCLPSNSRTIAVVHMHAARAAMKPELLTRATQPRCNSSIGNTASRVVAVVSTSAAGLQDNKHTLNGVICGHTT